jgi:hypothetical protein
VGGQASKAAARVVPVDAAAFAAPACAGAGWALPPTARNACWQAADAFAAFRCRQASAAEPPVGTPAQCAWQSLRQAWRIALAYVELGCCAGAGSVTTARSAVTLQIFHLGIRLFGVDRDDGADLHEVSLSQLERAMRTLLPAARLALPGEYG